VRTVPVSTWVKAAVDRWLTAAGINTGPACRAINKAGRIAPSGFSPKVIRCVVKAGCSKCGLDGVAPRDSRRTHPASHFELLGGICSTVNAWHLVHARRFRWKAHSYESSDTVREAGQIHA
jgi:hypothetical protein